MSRSLGITYKKPDGFVIRITDSLIKDKVSEMCIKNVIMHEILHTVPGCFNHGKLWKAMADVVNNSSYGYRVKRLAELEDLDKAVIKNRYKYVLKCKRCKKKIGFTKKNKIIKHFKDYRCQCGGKFKKIKY